jgi:hypothetical protein
MNLGADVVRAVQDYVAAPGAILLDGPPQSAAGLVADENDVGARIAEAPW